MNPYLSPYPIGTAVQEALSKGMAHAVEAELAKRIREGQRFAFGETCECEDCALLRRLQDGIGRQQ